MAARHGMAQNGAARGYSDPPPLTLLHQINLGNHMNDVCAYRSYTPHNCSVHCCSTCAHFTVDDHMNDSLLGTRGLGKQTKRLA